jgi:hypothetical protein
MRWTAVKYIKFRTGENQYLVTLMSCPSYGLGIMSLSICLRTAGAKGG